MAIIVLSQYQCRKENPESSYWVYVHWTRVSCNIVFASLLHDEQRTLCLMILVNFLGGKKTTRRLLNSPLVIWFSDLSFFSVCLWDSRCTLNTNSNAVFHDTITSHFSRVRTAFVQTQRLFAVFISRWWKNSSKRVIAKKKSDQFFLPESAHIYPN